MNKPSLICVALLAFALLAGCSSQQVGSKSSVVDYLYPTTAVPQVQSSIPLLKLPIKLGIAFVPEQTPVKRGVNFWSGTSATNDVLTETHKMEILEKIAGHFRTQKFIGEIQTIPSVYLTKHGSFTNLDQIKTMYGVDVIALVSYDQVQFTDDTKLSISYWTIVGAYLISGQKNDTNTLMDTVVYDIDSRRMLLRAPGISSVKGRSTPINLNEELRLDSQEGFERASNDMVNNLESQLAAFKEKIKQRPKEIKVENASHYSGSGAIDISLLLLLLASYIHCRFTRK